MDAVAALNEELQGSSPPPAVGVVLNFVVRDVPFDDGDDLDVHVDTSAGDVRLAYGRSPAADLTVRVGYDLARSIIVDRDTQAAMSAFLGGEVAVEGDVTRLFALAGQLSDPAAQEAADRVRALTA